MKDIEILMVGPSFEGHGGISAVARMQYDYLVSKKYRIYFLASTVEGNPFIKFFYTCMSYIKFMAIMLTSKISLIHIHSSVKRSFYRKSFYIFLARKLRKKVILQIHPERFLQFYRSSNKFLRGYIEKMFKELDAIIVLSSSIKRSFLEILPESNILVLNNPVCSSLFECQKDEDKKEKIILYMGWLIPEKGVYDIAQIIPEVLKSHPSAKFVFCGKNKNDGLRRLFKDSPFKNNIVIKDWAVGEEKRDLFRQSYMLVLPSYSEGLPNVILEAMSSSLPVIATSVGGVPEMIKDRVNGLLISPGDTEALKEKILLLLKNPELCREMGKVNRNLAVQNYDIEIVGKDLIHIYSKILA